jgi:ubiquinone/menaquinone biosynthesis C-methylase UbiE
VRDEASSSPTARRDAERVKGVLAERHTRSQAFFANAAAQWDRMRAELFGPRTELFALAGLLEPSLVVGDLGCGTGQLSETIAPFVQQVIAVDESAPMLKAARARLASRENVELREGSLEALPVADGALDLAVLSLVLHFVAEPVDALTEIRRVLRPGTGRLLLLDMLPHDHEEYQQTMGHVWLGISSDQLQQWSDAAGFRAMRYHALPAATQVKGPMLFAAVLQM